jgi:hypothetical protein
LKWLIEAIRDRRALKRDREGANSGPESALELFVVEAVRVCRGH